MGGYKGFKVIASWQDDKTLRVIDLQIIFPAGTEYENASEFLYKRDVKIDGYTDVSQIKAEFSKKFFGMPEEEIEVVELYSYLKTFK